MFMMGQFRLLFIFQLFGNLFIIVRCEIFVSNKLLKDAVNGAKVKNNELKELLQSHIDERLVGLERAERLIQELHDLSGDEIKDPTFKITHPFNAYRFIRNHSEIFNSTLMKAVAEISSFENETFTMLKTNITQLTEDLPNTKDLNGTVDAFHRLQKTYAIPTNTFADGSYLKARHSKLTADELSDVSAVLYRRGLHAAGLEWLEEAINSTDKENGSRAAIERVMRVSAKSALKARNHFAAMIILNGESKYVHRKTRLLSNNIKSSFEEFQKTAPRSEIAARKRESVYHAKEDTDFNRLCSGQAVKRHNSTKDSIPLFCRYETNGHPYMMLQPAKYEQLSSNPYIVVYHELFSGRELWTLKSEAREKLKRSTTGDGHIQRPSSNRISGSAVLYRNNAMVYDKVKVLTSLQPGGEAYQVANYGVGGFYASHFDAFHKVKNNRIATLMVYLTDVEMGGATVFERAHVSIFPKKGTAVFWHNMYRNATIMNRKTLHAACPVIKGDKWVGTAWIRQIGQELRLPCTLNKLE